MPFIYQQIADNLIECTWCPTHPSILCLYIRVYQLLLFRYTWRVENSSIALIVLHMNRQFVHFVRYSSDSRWEKMTVQCIVSDCYIRMICEGAASIISTCVVGLILGKIVSANVGNNFQKYTCTLVTLYLVPQQLIHHKTFPETFSPSTSFSPRILDLANC